MEPGLHFDIELRVDAGDIDALGHVNNVVYVRWIQEAAVAHWRAYATVEQQADFVWVVLRHEIDYKNPAHLGDEILARTWVGTATRLSFERHTEILRKGDGRLLAQARTLWCPIDARSGRPKNVGPDVRARFSQTDIGRESTTR